MKKMILIFTLIFANISFAQVTYEAKVSGMVCSFCANGIEKHLKEIDTVKNVTVDLDEYKVTIKSEKELKEELIKKKITDAGYKMEKLEKLD